ncbi:MAG: DUF4422 domain-containing protein [Bacilli bacterium]
MSKIKIFPIYHNKSILFQSDVYEPIQTGCSNTDLDLGILKDNTGDHISNKNTQLGELTAWYWIWKNYLPQHPELEYIGFCHYRRFFDFEKAPAWGIEQPFVIKFHFSKFQNIFQNISKENNIYNIVKKHDVILPKLWFAHEKTIYQKYVSAHPQQGIDALIDIIKKDYPDYVEDMNDFLHNNKNGYFCLNFVMKVELFDDLMIWVFDLLAKLETRINLSQYSDYDSIRTPAYLIERFFNIWLIHQIKSKKTKILERESYFLIPESEQTRKIFHGIFLVDKAKKRVKKLLNFFGFNFKVSS